MKLIFTSLFSLSLSLSIYSQGSFDFSAGWMFNGINDSEMEGSPFVNVGFSTQIIDEFEASVSVSGNKLGIEGLSGTFLQPELKFVFKNNTPIVLNFGAFVSTLISEDENLSYLVKLKGFNSGLIGGIGLRHKKAELFADFLLGLTNVMELEDNFESVLDDLGIEKQKARTRSIRVGFKYHF